MLKQILRLLHSHTDVKKLESISAKPFFKHYKNGINLSVENRLEEANQQFNKSLSQIKISKENELQHFSYILRRIAHNCRRMGKMKEAEERLYDVIKHKRECKVNPALLYDDYDVLFRHLLSYDLDKSVKLCKALLLKEKEDMPNSHIKLFNFNIGTAYLLAGNYTDAKNRLSKCIDTEPLGKLKSYAYNNLALACWWHKNPIELVRDNIESADNSKVEKDFSQVKQIFAKSIQASESLNKEASQVQRMMLAETLDFKKGSLNEKLQLASAPSLFPAYNIAKFYIMNDPLQRIQIIYWLKKALSLAQTLKNESFFDHILAEYSILTSNMEPLLQKLPHLIQKNRYSQHFINECNYCKILGNLLDKTGRKQEAEQYRKRAKLIESALPSWVWKLRYVAMDELDLTN